MNFKQTIILSTILCVVLTSIQTTKSLGYFSFFDFIGAFIAANVLVIIYLLVKRKKEKSNLTFFVLQNILALMSMFSAIANS
mgnify:CR=1 FL=1|jgi:glycerol uptake facilitator-like aquaporin